MIIYGCECSGAQCSMHPYQHGPAEKAPVAYKILRYGKEMLVCSYCILSSDQMLAIVPTTTDKVAIFMAFDWFGGLRLTLELGEKEGL
jgi:hypothetical protein